MTDTSRGERGHFIRQIIDRDIQAGLAPGAVHTRFPPEPNGYLHIGHAKSICLNFGLAGDYGGRCNLRFDDTNPHKENIEFVEAIQADVRWLGFDWQERLYFASDYFEQLYGFAVQLIEKGLAYVCDLTPEQTREYRGTLTEPGRPSPNRDRSVDENLDLFRRMRAGEFADGSRTLRARIDMASPNLNLRDPVIYRIRHGVIHHQTGAEWCIYPMYDFTHSLSDAIEGITHSLCTLEFEDHRPLYDWFVDNVDAPSRPRQYEFSRLALQYTVTSKRRLTRLVEDGLVEGWDDPRMPTLAGLRRRGVPPEAIREFCARIGVTKSDNSIEMELLESCIREQMDARSPRAMVVLNPLRVTLANYPQDGSESLVARNHPKDESMGTRPLSFGRNLFIDREDFREEANKKYKRLVSGGAVRLRYGYVIRCTEVRRNPAGEIEELVCEYFPDSLENNPDGLKVRGVIHWVDAATAVPVQVRLYDRLFSAAFPDREEDFLAHLNPQSLVSLDECLAEASLNEPDSPVGYQFEREGYFSVDAGRSAELGRPVFNRTATLRDTWGKVEARGEN